jgi:hypothetical protein
MQEPTLRPAVAPSITHQEDFMPEDRFGNSFDDPRTRYESDRADPNRLYPDDRDLGRSNASVGWIVGAVVLLGILVYAFGWKVDDQTAGTPAPPVTTGQNTARPAPTPGPMTPAPSATPSPQPSTTGAGQPAAQ